MILQLKFLLLIVGLYMTVTDGQDCNKPPKMMNPKECCPIPEFITPEIKKACMDEMEAKMKPGQKKNRMNPCFVSCMLRKAGITDTKEIPPEKFNSYIRTVFKDNKELQSVASAAFANCSTKVEEFRKQNMQFIKNAPAPEPGCHYSHAFIIGCSAMSLVENCPAAMWTNKPACNEARAFVQKCKSKMMMGPDAKQ
ncbi:maker75 [Drosophila busckii]|uniref:Maker75 n=1 Tax=Drosophila busckii TaxID=30019 RepID=A0A0M5JA87_DROBS|nr:general odorant-binding protein 68 [Drosophila busckii]ALC41494.1 maker75 [Drosophila busckii]